MSESLTPDGRDKPTEHFLQGTIYGDVVNASAMFIHKTRKPDRLIKPMPGEESMFRSIGYSVLATPGVNGVRIIRENLGPRPDLLTS